MEAGVKSSLKRGFVKYVSCAITVIVMLSATTVWACYRLQAIILPAPNEAVISLTTIDQYGDHVTTQTRFTFGKEFSLPVMYEASYTLTPEGLWECTEEPPAFELDKNPVIEINKIDSGYSALSARQKTVYTSLTAAKVALPMLYSVIGVFVCASLFYKRKLQVPIALLVDAAHNISEQNLDFSLAYQSNDEMEVLCDSFEQMRQALYQNNQELWNMMEGRRTLMASVAHDLRNPISIIEGYVEYLQANIPIHHLSDQDLMEMVKNISAAAKRLGRYTDSLRDLHHIEEQALHPAEISLSKLIDDMAEDFALLGKANGITVLVENQVQPGEVSVDGQVLYRILENVVSNALRYAKDQIQIHFRQHEKELTATVTDDGPGFPANVLKSKDYIYSDIEHSEGHLGMGLAICRILCAKHYGSLTLSNRKGGGACVTIRIITL